MKNNSGKSILLVEDEAIIAMAQKRELDDYGYNTRIASTGEEAIELVLGKSISVDLILFDINLGPGIDGTEAAKRILENIDIPIIFLSSHTEREVVEKTEGISSYGYVVKNAGIVVLDASIKMAFKLFNANREIKKNPAGLDPHVQCHRSPFVYSGCGPYHYRSK